MQKTCVKAKVMAEIEKAVEDAKHHKVDHFILYYIGHGHQGDGAWVTYQTEAERKKPHLKTDEPTGAPDVFI